MHYHYATPANCRGTRIRTETKSSQRTRATVTLYPVNIFYFSTFSLIFQYDIISIMNFKEILSQLNIVAYCRKYGLSIWQCPQFLFLIMGIVIMISAVVTYALGTRYVADPTTVTMIVFVLTIVLFVITFSMTRSLEGLAEANRLKSEFVSIASHQLRSPLSNLKLALEFLRSGRAGKINKQQSEYFKILKENTARMIELVSSLLTVSRIEQGKLLMHKSEFSLEDLTKEIISRISLLTLKIKIRMEAAKDIPRAFADPSQIKLVIENLLDNAIRYSNGNGDVEVKISSRKKELTLEVKDKGVGIPKKDQKHIYQKFFRSSNALRHRTQGSGLGLYIAKSIIEKSGGKLKFESIENKGSTFWFTIPIK